MSSLKVALARFFYGVSVAFGLLDIDYYDVTRRSGFLRIYSTAFTALLLISTPVFLIKLMNNLYDTQELPKLIKIVWGIEYIALFVVAYFLYLSVTFNRKSITKLIENGLKLLKTHSSPPMMHVLLAKLIIEYSLFITIAVGNSFFFFTSFEAHCYVALPYFYSLLSFFSTNVFIFALSLIQAKLAEINIGMRDALKNENNLSFLVFVGAHKRLQEYCGSVIVISSKSCLANFLYAFTTTLSSVRRRK
jgi:hypothetical protein